MSVKSACSTQETPSKAVFAIIWDWKNALSSWRVSLSHLTTQEEITETLCIFIFVIRSWYHEKSTALSNNGI